MSDVVPLLLLPVIAGWWFAGVKRRRAHAALHAAITRTRRPLLLDAGHATVVDVARSLELVDADAPAPCPWWIVGRARTAWEVRQLAAPLGLALTHIIGVRRSAVGRNAGYVGCSRFVGRRYDRHVTVELGVDRTTVSLAAISSDVVFDRASVDGGATGRLTACADAPAALRAAMERLRPSRQWCGVHVEASGDRLVLIRRGTAPASWLHALWLAELVADLIAASPPSVHAASHASGRAARRGAPVRAGSGTPVVALAPAIGGDALRTGARPGRPAPVERPLGG
jgi:hypothetical protein